MPEFQIGDRVGISVGDGLFKCAIVYRRPFTLDQTWVNLHDTYCDRPWITNSRVEKTLVRWSEVPYENRAYTVFRPIDPNWMKPSYVAGEIVQLGGWHFEVVKMLRNYPREFADERERIQVRFLHNNQISNIIVRFT